MVAIQNTLVSDEVFTECFCCNLNKCKGCCCIEGDAGAPLRREEIPLLERYYPEYSRYMTGEARRQVARNGYYEVFDLDNSLVTPIINGRDCVYLTCDPESGIAYCAIEKAFREGAIPFRKPLSCWLFPIRIQHYAEYDAVNYFRWDICRDAEVNGRREKIPVFRFLREPLTELYGEEWYNEAEAAYKAVFANKV